MGALLLVIVYTFSSLRFSFKMQLYFQLSPSFISFLKRESSKEKKLMLERWLSKTQKVRVCGLPGPALCTSSVQKHSSRWGSRLFPRPSLPVGYPSPAGPWTGRGKTGFTTLSSQHMQPRRRGSWAAVSKPHSPLTCHSQAGQKGSPAHIRNSCPFERGLNC